MLTRFLETALSAHRILVRILARPSRISYVSVHRDNVKRIEIQIEREREREEREKRKKRNREECLGSEEKWQTEEGETLSKHGGVSGDESPAV